MALFQCLYFLPAKKREVLQVANHVSIVDSDPELVEFVDTGSGGIQPDCARDRFAELRAVGVGDEWQGQAVDAAAQFSAGEVDPGGDVAPLIAAADLQPAIVITAKDIKIKRL